MERPAGVLTFDGVDSAFFLWINGRQVGYSVNSRCPAEFDVTTYLQPGQNDLAVEVYRYSAGSYLEDQDMWRLSGIFRNVYLWSAAQQHVRDFFVKTDFDAEYRNAVLDVTATVKNYGGQPAPERRLKLALFDQQGRPVAGVAAEAAVPELQPGQEKEVRFTAKVAEPAKWTAETPHLYTTVLTLGDEILSCRTGFRKVKIKGRLFTINGVPVKLKGANRHENWPDTGHYVTEQRMIVDLKLLKGCNCNHVRTCHYTDDPRWYELCDEWGIYLVAEANVECHGLYGILDREPRCRKAIVDRNVANVQTKKNHPSVIIWSLGNENGGGDNFRAALKAIKAIDSRPVHYEPFGIEKNNPADIDSQMYPGVDWVERVGKSDRKKPYYMCEYAHAMNNSMGGIADYNDVIDRHEGLMGAAIWEWEDQALWNLRDPANPHLVYGGGFGEVPNDFTFICKGVVFADRTPTPKYAEAKRAYQWINMEPENLHEGKIRIRNKYQFIGLDGFIIAWTVTEDGTVINRGTLPPLDLKPQATATLTVPVYRNLHTKPGAVYRLRVAFLLAKDTLWAKAGYEVAAAQFEVLPPVRFVARKNPALPLLAIEEDQKLVVVSGKDFRVSFDRSDGAIAELVYRGRPVLKQGGGPRLHVWRAPHINDDMWTAHEWKALGLNALTHRARSIRAIQIKPSLVHVVVDAVAEGKARNGFDQQIAYAIDGDGTIVVNHAVERARRAIRRRATGSADVCRLPARPFHLPWPRPHGKLFRPGARLRLRALLEHYQGAAHSLCPARGVRQPRERSLGGAHRPGRRGPVGPGCVFPFPSLGAALLG